MYVYIYIYIYIVREICTSVHLLRPMSMYVPLTNALLRKHWEKLGGKYVFISADVREVYMRAYNIRARKRGIDSYVFGYSAA